MGPPSVGDRFLPRALPWILIAATAAVPLSFRYLPMTDFPQHVAVASIIGHIGDPRFGFEPYYRVDFSRAPYVLPYFAALQLARVMPLAAAMRCIVAAAVALQLLAILLLLRASEKPGRLLLLAVPFAFHRGFFWGFVHFELALALAMFGMALLVQANRGRAENAALLCVIAALVFTHVYGLLLFAGFAAVFGACGGTLKGARLATAIAILGAGAWAWSGMGQAGNGQSFSPPIWNRILEFPSNVLGGWADRSEALVLAAFAMALLVLTWDSVPVTRSRWERMSPATRALWIVVIGNLALYFVVPQSLPAAKFVHLRHAIIAVLLAPALADVGTTARRVPLVTVTLLIVVGIGGLLNAWDHFRLFDREARSFDGVVNSIEERPRLAMLTFDRRGGVAETPAYLHFGAYVQAARGGFMAASFPELFWNIPVERRSDAPAPVTPADFEWRPRLIESAEMTEFYEWIIVRLPGPGVLQASRAFPYEPVLVEPPWQLYRRRARAR